MSKNSLGRELPEQVGSYRVRPYEGAYQPLPEVKPVVTRRTAGHRVPGGNKLVPTLKDAIIASGLKDGMTISFHHSFREGDKVIGQVLTAIRALGIKGLRFAPSAVVNIKEPSIVDFVKDGTINRIEASGIRGQLGDAILSGEVELAEPVILRTHGGRPRAIEAGELQIDVAFIGASAADDYGNCTSQIGPNACGSMGYSFVDAHNAGCVVVVTDNLVDYPCCPVSISQQYVDYVVKVDAIGDPAKIGAGAARLTKNPRDLMIAQRTVDVMSASRRFKDGFSFQTGAGAISIATTKYLAERMKERGVKASFALGGGPDVAGGAQVSIVTIPVIRGRTPSIVKKVFTTCTPGETVAVVVTEAGIALNPKHKNYQELKEDLEAAGLKLVTIEELQQLAESMTGVPKPIETGDKVVCMVEYRDGSVVDVIRQIKK